MTGSLIIVGFFFLGCLLGWSGLMHSCRMRI
jgi:hypothetical protein